VTTATLTVSRSQYTTAPHHAHFSGSTSTVTTGTLRDAQFDLPLGPFALGPGLSITIQAAATDRIVAAIDVRSYIAGA
jgi:hypothetical protein